MNKLFVYGIFLDQTARDRYGMSYPHYAVVKGFATRYIRDGIVEAVEDSKYALTGLVVDVEPFDRMSARSNWERLDAMEAGYNRIKVATTDGQDCWMYVSKFK